MHVFTRNPDIRIAIVDDHKLFSDGLKQILEKLPDIDVVFEAVNGKDLQEKLKRPENEIDIALMDIQMPIMDGYEASIWLQQNFPKVKVIALSMRNDEFSIIKMINHGACGYILKEATIREVHETIIQVFENGFCLDITLDGEIFYAITKDSEKQLKKSKRNLKFSPRELEFIQHAASDLAYKQIAEKMGISFTTVENYRASCFEKLNINSRVGLVIYAIKNNIIKI
jgi:DNA-binding NarL/FixJ family response regulator